MIQILVPGVL